jgi:hypothetical protein
MRRMIDRPSTPSVSAPCGSKSRTSGWSSAKSLTGTYGGLDTIESKVLPGSSSKTFDSMSVSLSRHPAVPHFVELLSARLMTHRRRRPLPLKAHAGSRPRYNRILRRSRRTKVLCSRSGPSPLARPPSRSRGADQNIRSDLELESIEFLNAGDVLIRFATRSSLQVRSEQLLLFVGKPIFGMCVEKSLSLSSACARSETDSRRGSATPLSARVSCAYLSASAIDVIAGYLAPSPRQTAGSVRKIILRSSQSDQFSRCSRDRSAPSLRT